MAFYKGQAAHYKPPQHVSFIDELPVATTRKTQKFVMRNKMIEELT